MNKNKREGDIVAKKLLLTVGILLFAFKLNAEELRPQFRAWKSSAIQGGNYTNVLLATSSIIFHMYVGSPTVNNQPSVFTLYRSTGSNGTTAFMANSSTKAIVTADSSLTGGMGMGVAFDVFSDSLTYYSKTGGSSGNILYDFYREPPFNPFPKD